MFNRTVLAFGGGTTHEHHTHVEMVDPSIEKGARFLDEVQTKAAERITETLLVDVPGIEAQLVRYDLSRSFDTGALEHRVAFRVNGKPFDFHLSTDQDAEAVKLLIEKITDTLLRQIAPSTIMQLTKRTM